MFFPHFQTLQRAVETTGIGLHSGAEIRLRLVPRAQCGVVFARLDLPGAPEIAVKSDAISHTTHATTLQENGASVSTTEHLLAALWMCDITHCRVEVDGPEVPIWDGSARDWCRLIAAAGTVQVAQNAAATSTSSTRSDARPIWALREPVFVENGTSSVLALPHHKLRASIFADFGRDYLEPQLFDITLSSAVFDEEIAPARTFTLEEWIEPLRAQDLIAGGTTENAIVLGKTAPSVPLRFPNELARHKALDLLGDMALLFAPDGGILRAHFVACRAGHGLHQQWMKRCIAQNALVRLEDKVVRYP